jgi:hypothetical protein
MGKSLLSKLGTGLERVFGVDGKVVQREELLARVLAVGTRAVLEILKTEKGTLFLHSNLQETHTYFQCTAADLKTVAATMLKFAETK